MDKCPDCGGDRIIEGTDDFLVDGKPFLERSGYCNECGWSYSHISALRMYTDNQRARGIGPPLPADPFADTVLMLDPAVEAAAGVADQDAER